MPSEFKPLQMKRPTIARRRGERPRPVPLPAEIVAKRKLIARSLLDNIKPISKSLSKMTDDQRKAVFLKIEHSGKIDLVGTDLKAISQESSHVTLAIPRTSDLTKLENKISDFGTGKVDKLGMLPNGHLVKNLISISQGSPKDRLCEAFRKDYSKLTKRKSFLYELELLTVKQGPKQQKFDLERIRLEIDAVIRADQYGAIFEHYSSKGSCRMVIRSSGATFKKLVEGSQFQRSIVLFDSRPNFETFFQTVNKFQASNLGTIKSPDDNAPTVCVIDSGFSQGNLLLKPISKPGLIKSFLKSKPSDGSDEHGHGSGVSSMVSYYAIDINTSANNVAKFWIASARILDEQNLTEDSDQGDDGRLLMNVIREVVETFVPLGVKIFNLSVNDINRRWSDKDKQSIPRNSWVARAIDYVSREFDIVFVISTGNILPDQIQSFISKGKTYPKYLLEDDAKLLDPAQSALAVSVGSISHSTTLIGPNSAGDSPMAEIDFPSPFTRVGPGINGEIKPDVVERGGNYISTSNGGIKTNPGTDLVMAGRETSPALAYRSGTSFAAPRVAHSMADIQQQLTNMGITPSASLLKAFCINSAKYPSPQSMQTFLSTLNPATKESWMNIYGNGVPDRRNATEAGPYSAILFFQGSIKPNRVAFLSVPVPKELAFAERGLKRLTVTFCYSPEVQRWGLEKYLGTTAKWRLFRGDIDQQSVVDAMSVFDEDDSDYSQRLDQELQFDPGINLRSRGTVQHASFEWTSHQVEYSQNQYTLAIATYERWNRTTEVDIPFAVVVRIEDLTSSCQVYQLVKTSIEVQTEISIESNL